MSKQERDAKHGFFSKYAGGYVTAPQYLTEQLCINIANNRNEQLSDKFWKYPKWQKIYRSQIHTAYHLLEQYSIHAALQVLRDHRAKRITSFRSPSFIRLIKLYQAKLDLIYAAQEKK